MTIFTFNISRTTKSYYPNLWETMSSLKKFHVKISNGAMEKHSSFCPQIANSNPDKATAIHGKDSKRAEMAVLSEWEGCHVLSPVNHRSWIHYMNV